MASFTEILHYLRKDVSGEVDGVVQSAVSAAWPGLNFKSLVPASGRNGTTDYLHPRSGEVVASQVVHHEKTTMIKQRTYWGRSYFDQQTTPGHFSYRIYAPEGHVTSTIKGMFAKLSPTENLPYVTEVKDFFPPSAHRNNAKAKRDENLKYIIDKNRRDARKAKEFRTELLYASVLDDAPRSNFQNGFKVLSIIPTSAIRGRIFLEPTGIHKNPLNPRSMAMHIGGTI